MDKFNVNDVNILHISDLHFCQEDKTDESKRKTALNSIIKAVKNLGVDWKPNIIVISGDIAWTSVEEEYKYASEYINRLLSELEVDNKHLVICPGNHDINLDIAEEMGLLTFTNCDKCCHFLKYESFFKHVAKPFIHYEKFCESIGMEKYATIKEDPSKYSYLTGFRHIDGIDFVVLNSSWFIRKNDNENICIALPQIEYMYSEGYLKNSDSYDSANITIVVVHHPEEYISEHDLNSYNNKTPAYEIVANGSHIILSGHTHGNLKEPKRVSNHARLFTNGATYNGSDYQNNFSIYKINIPNRLVSRKAFDYIPSSKEWKENKSISKSYKLTKENIGDQKQLICTDAANFDIYKRFENAGIIPGRLASFEELKKINKIIWPVVPRPNVNVIHKGQIEIIRLLVHLGAELKVIISNYDVADVDSEAFRRNLDEYLSSINITNKSIVLLDEYYNNQNKIIMEKFSEISRKIQLKDLIEIRKKQFSDEEKKAIEEESVLKNIRPLLSISAVFLEAVSDLSKKSVVIAGQDDSNLWFEILKRETSNIAMLFNPVLNFGEYTANQNKYNLVYFTIEEFRDVIMKGNAYRWMYNMFIYIQDEVAYVKKDGYSLDDINPVWNESIQGIPEWIDKEKLIKFVFNKVRSA